MTEQLAPPSGDLESAVDPEDSAVDPEEQVTPERESRARASMRGVGLLIGLGLLAAMALVSLRFGSIWVTNSDVLSALFSFDPDSYNQTAVRELRAPRTIFAIVVGMGLGVAGGVAQGVTRNPMADPFILGITGGASLGIANAVYFGKLDGSTQHIWFAFGGALIASLLVYTLGQAGPHGGSPVRLILAGVITGTLMSTWTAVLIYTDEETRETMRHIMIGSVSGRDVGDFWLPLLAVVIGVVACVLMGHQINVLNLGEDAARAAGMNTSRIRLACTLIVVVIAGGAVAAAGPIGFVGLAVPHMVRSFTGPDYRWILAYSAVAGAMLLIGADILGRFLLHPAELEASIVMGAIGAPFFIYIARRRSLAA
nr:iron ABC transporter permease [Micromonospora sp. DSM 115978]